MLSVWNFQGELAVTRVSASAKVPCLQCIPGSIKKLRIKRRHKSYTTKLSINQYVCPVCLWSIPVCLICHYKLQRASLSDKLTFPRKRRGTFSVLYDNPQVQTAAAILSTLKAHLLKSVDKATPTLMPHVEHWIIPILYLSVKAHTVKTLLFQNPVSAVTPVMKGVWSDRC